MIKIHRHLTIAATFVALTACSGSDAATPPLDTEAPTTTIESAPTIPPDTTTTTTVAPESAATILVTTTEAPETTTTVAPPATDPTSDADLIAEIEADLNENGQAFLAAGSDPGSAGAAAVIEERYAGDDRDARLRLFQTLVESGLVIRANPDLMSRIEVLELLDSVPDSAVIRVCEIDAAVVVRTPDDEFPEGVIVNDRISRYINEVTVRFEAGRWISAGGQSLDESVIGSAIEATCDDF